MSQGYARTSPWRSSAQSAIWRTKGRYDRCNGVRMSCPRTGRPLNDPKHRNQSFRTIHLKNYLRIEQPFLTSVAVVVFNQKKNHPREFLRWKTDKNALLKILSLE